MRPLRSIALLVALAAAPAAAQPERALRIAVEGAFPPFNYVEGGELQGFEVELGKALCAEMKARCTFVVHEWDGIVKGLLRGEYDAILSSFFVNERRRKRVLFSRPYYRVPSAFAARSDGPFGDIGPAALEGKTIGVVEGSAEAAYLEARYPGSQVRGYAKLDDASLDLLTERIDLVFGDKLALSKFLESREGADCCRFAGDAPFDPAHHGEGAAVALRPQDAELKEAFDRAIGAVIADGAYDRIRERYFPFDIKPSP